MLEYAWIFFEVSATFGKVSEAMMYLPYFGWVVVRIDIPEQLWLMKW